MAGTALFVVPRYSWKTRMKRVNRNDNACNLFYNGREIVENFHAKIYLAVS